MRAAVLALVGVGGAAFADGGAFAAGVAEKGRAIAQDHCARCHAVGLEGESPFPPAPPFRDLARRWPPESLAEALAEGIVVGHPAMPRFEFTPPQIDDLIAYLKTLERP